MSELSEKKTWFDVKAKLDKLLANTEANTCSRGVCKLKSLYHGKLKFPNAAKFYLIFFSHSLTENHKHLLNLVSKYHFKHKVDSNSQASGEKHNKHQ